MERKAHAFQRFITIENQMGKTTRTQQKHHRCYNLKSEINSFHCIFVLFVCLFKGTAREIINPCCSKLVCQRFQLSREGIEFVRTRVSAHKSNTSNPELYQRVSCKHDSYGFVSLYTWPSQLVTSIGPVKRRKRNCTSGRVCACAIWISGRKHING